MSKAHTPYTYVIGWSKLDLWYYGCQFSQKASPDNLWKKYFTSSRKVKMIRETYGEPDVIEIRMTFSTSEQCRKCETKAIQRARLVERSNWLNQTDNTGKFYWYGPRASFSEEHRRKMSEAKKGKKQPQEMIDKRVAQNTGKKRTKETCEKISRSNKGKIISEESRRKMSESLKGREVWNTGKSFSDDTKKKMSVSQKDRFAKNPDSNGMFGKRMSEESKKKMSQAKIAYWKKRKMPL